MIWQPASAAYLCEGVAAGEKADMGGYMQVQEGGSFYINDSSGGYLIEVLGETNGEANVQAIIHINEAMKKKLDNCPQPVNSTKINFTVVCQAKGEPELLTAECRDSSN